jgi:purine-nucleoside/S-methyl-5'-thioadenosine phosphorylase / adenosine deaminase
VTAHRAHPESLSRVAGSPLRVLEADLGPGVRAGFTTRAGGVSTNVWEGLDLGLHTGDDPDRVLHNRGLLAEWAGAPVRFGRQVHGTTVAVVRGADDGIGEADALVTAVPGVPVGVLVADCVPVLLADASAGVVAAVHAGRRGLLAGVLGRAVDVMTAAGARAEDMRAAVGPSAGGCCYEVPAELQEQACAGRPELRATTTWGTPALDLRAGAVAELAGLGLAVVGLVGGCTIEDSSFYSYRRAPVTGRFAGVVALVP